MIKTVQDAMISIEKPTTAFGEDVAAIVELSAEETDLVGGGPEVENDPGEH